MPDRSPLSHSVAAAEDLPLEPVRLGARGLALRAGLPSLLAVASLALLGSRNYLAFHTVVELASVIVSFSVFLLTWNVRRITRDPGMVLLGVAYGCVGLLDLLHTMAYRGFGVLPATAGANPATQLWMAARIVEALGLAAWTWSLGRPVALRRDAWAFVVLTLVLAAGIAAGRFPACYVEGRGLTAFKVGCEYATSAVMAAAAIALARRRRLVARETADLLAAAMIVKILGSLAFTLYVDVFGYTNMLGHILKVVGLVLVYLAIVRAGLVRPYTVLLHRYLAGHAALSRVSSRWESFLMNADWPMAVVDRAGMVREANPAMAAMVGRSRAEVLDRPAVAFVPPGVGERFVAHLTQVARLGAAISARDTLPGQDGGAVLVESTLFPIEGEGEDAVFGLIMRDVTARVAEDRRFARIVETAMDGFWLIDADGMVREVNRAAADMLGYGTGELPGMPIAAIDANEDPPAVLAHVRRVTELGSDRFETRHRRRDGSVIDVEVCTSTLRDGQGSFVAFVRDISARKRADALVGVRVRLSEYAFGHTLGELLQYTLDEAERLTGSSIGFMHFMEDDQCTLSLQRWSTNTLAHMCTAEGTGRHYDLSQAGVWADCVRERRPVVHNDYASLAERRGMPPGHAPVVRELVVPVIRQGQVVAILGVGNKETDYDDRDIDLVTQLADLAWDIAGNKRAELALSESEDRYRSLFENISDPVLVIDQESLAILDANRSARERYALGRGDQAIGYAAQLFEVGQQEAAAAMLREGGGDPQEIWRHAAGGREFPVRIHTSRVELRGRTQLVAVVRDVTAELKAVDDQRERTDYLATLIGNIADVITILEPDGTIRFESPNLPDRFGFGADERLGRDIARYVHPADRALLGATLARVAARPDASEAFELRVACKDGTTRSAACVLRNLVDDERVHGILFNCRDETDRRMAEDRFRLAFQTSPDGIAITTVGDGIYVDVNQGFLDLSGFSREELIGRSSLEIGIWPSAEERRKLTEPMRSQGVAHNVEITYGRRDGTARTGLISANFILLGGEPHILSITRDITELRRAEAERHQLELQLQQAQKLESVGRLAGGIAHDFNNLLTVIAGNAELARLTLGDDHPVAGEVDMISRTAERAAALTSQLLAYSREQVSNPRAVNLRELVLSDMRLVQRMIGEEIELVTDCPPSPFLVEVDPVQLQQVLFNLCINARDAMPDGGSLAVATRDVVGLDEVCLGCGERFQGDWAELTVRDTGTGIAPENLGRIFDPFFTTKDVGKGTGMGLATALGIVTKANGHLTASSTPGEGTTFRVYLPHHRRDAGREAIREPGAVEPGRGERILVVEDDPGVQATIVSVLERFGYRVTMAGDPVAALALLADGRARPDLIVSDVVMPRMNGEQLLHEVRATGSRVPFLFMSGYPADLLHGRELLAPDRPYLRKPVAPAELLRAVRAGLAAAVIPD